MIPSFTRQRLLLVLGDIALILLATYLSPLICFGRFIDIFLRHTGASTFTLFLYLIMLYIFDLYNMGRGFQSRDTVLRTSVAVALTGIFSAFLFYSLPSWKFGRGIFVIQIILVWGFLGCWRWLFSMMFPITVEKENVLILGVGRSGTTLHHMLGDPASPYRVVGFLDDDPAKQGQVVGSPAVLGTIGQLSEIAAQKGAKTAILAITQERSHELMCRLL